MIHISLFELSVTAGTGIDVVSTSPATNALHPCPPLLQPGTQTTVGVKPEIASRLFDVTSRTYQFQKVL